MPQCFLLVVLHGPSVNMLNPQMHRDKMVKEKKKKKKSKKNKKHVSDSSDSESEEKKKEKLKKVNLFCVFGDMCFGWFL